MMKLKLRLIVYIGCIGFILTAITNPCFGDISIETEKFGSLWTDAELYHEIKKDLNNISPEKQKYIRYFSLESIWNRLSLEDRLSQADAAATLETYKSAVATTLSSLSWSAFPVQPSWVRDPSGRSLPLLRVDLTALGVRWNKSEEDGFEYTAQVTHEAPQSLPHVPWTYLAFRYPYPISALLSDYLEVSAKTQCPFPVLRGDWFVHEAWQYPTYSRILFNANQRKEEKLLIESLFSPHLGLGMPEDQVPFSGLSHLKTIFGGRYLRAVEKDKQTLVLFDLPNHYPAIVYYELNSDGASPLESLKLLADRDEWKAVGRVIQDYNDSFDKSVFTRCELGCDEPLKSLISKQFEAEKEVNVSSPPSSLVPLLMAHETIKIQRRDAEAHARELDLYIANLKQVSSLRRVTIKQKKINPTALDSAKVSSHVCHKMRSGEQRDVLAFVQFYFEKFYNKNGRLRITITKDGLLGSCTTSSYFWGEGTRKGRCIWDDGQTRAERDFSFRYSPYDGGHSSLWHLFTYILLTVDLKFEDVDYGYVKSLSYLTATAKKAWEANRTWEWRVPWVDESMNRYHAGVMTPNEFKNHFYEKEDYKMIYYMGLDSEICFLPDSDETELPSSPAEPAPYDVVGPG